MMQFQLVAVWLVAGYLRLTEQTRGGQPERLDSGRRVRDDRGDVPGWVMVTVITTDRIRRWQLRARK
jgi:hypothetical protein